MRLAPRIALAALVAAGTTAGGAMVTGAHEGTSSALGPGPVTVVIDIEHSRFEPAQLEVMAGTTVRFVVVNGDPIQHELIVGPPAVHARHEDGTEQAHPPVPGEVSVPPLTRAVTTYTFDRPGDVVMACHLPGHYDFGMRGTVTVQAAPANKG